MTLEKTSISARGRWRGILERLGIDPKLLDGRHHACPLCGDGKDRFRWDDKDGSGSYFCSQCGAGSGLDFVMKARGWDFARAAKEVDGWVGLVPIQERQAERTEAQKRMAMRHLLKSADPLTFDTPAYRYLQSRCGALDGLTADLRAHQGLKHLECGGVHPALLAILRYPDGKGASVHRTFLTQDGRKAPVDPVRKIASCSPLEGAAVRLGPIQDQLGIGEGIETSICAGHLYGLTVWSGISANGILNWILPEGVRSVVIFGDNDAHKTYEGQVAAFTKAKQLRLKGIDVEVFIPPRSGSDWADVWIEQQQMQKVG